MEHKRVNLGYLTFLILEIILILTIGIWDRYLDLDDSMVSTLLAESTILIPPIIFIFLGRKEYSIKERVGLKLMKPSTVVIVILYAIVVMPIGTLANAISMLWVDNTVLEASGTMLDNDWYMALIAIAIVAPFVEEFCFRGFVYNGYRYDGARLSAVFMSALMFAFMHMNFNQAAYAFVIGIAFAVIYEATGSLWSSFICHSLFNAESVILMFIADHFYPGIYDEMTINRDEIMSDIPVYAIVAVFAIVIGICLIYVAAKIENRHERLKELFEGFNYGAGSKKVKIVTAPLVISLVLLFAYMILSEVVNRMM